ncbi:ROK family protein [Alloactinosynnema sp. L-07]|uniref:ROK family transcriptional regulator n=1 Tax=Alloactinosynnema sp. L-07 TaxID=1653480 RepID=UPI0012FA071D|nr:ROK family protein [Alloactinosynnema sp. L-07]
MTQLRYTGKATKESLRERNDALVLQSVAQGGRARTDVVRETGLPAATVSTIVSALVERRLVREAGHAVSRGGKPRTLLELDEDHHRFIGVHVGTDRATAQLLTLTGRVERRASTALPAQFDPAAVARLIRRVSTDNVTAIGLSVPGIVDRDSVVRSAISFGWNWYPLGSELSRRCGGVPVHVVNDANAIALAEVARSTDPGPDLVLLWLGTGIGAGIVLDGRLHEGRGFRSGEIGHVDIGVALRCHCGLGGCLETVAALPTILGDASPEVVARYASWADDSTTHALGKRVDRAAHGLARAVSMLTAALDVDEFVVGGPVADHRIGPRLLAAVNAVLAARVMSGFTPVRLRYSAFGEDSAVVGAAAHAIRQEFGVALTMAAEPPQARGTKES